MPINWVNGVTPVDAPNMEIIDTDIAARQVTSEKGAANGYAPLDATAKVPVANLPPVSGVDYIGNWAAPTAFKRGDVVRYNGNDYLAVNDSVGQTPPAPASGGVSAPAWTTGDTKVSAKTANHADPQGGTWYLADGSALPGGETALIALIGSTLPDAKGRDLIMLGTNAAVNAIGKNDGVTTVANRRPQHRHTPHLHAMNTAHTTVVGGAIAALANGVTAFYTQVQATADGGSGVATDALDSPPFVVVGNLFYHS